MNPISFFFSFSISLISHQFLHLNWKLQSHSPKRLIPHEQRKRYQLESESGTISVEMSISVTWPGIVMGRNTVTAEESSSTELWDIGNSIGLELNRVTVDEQLKDKDEFLNSHWQEVTGLYSEIAPLTTEVGIEIAFNSREKRQLRKCGTRSDQT
jgi:hypothetical protein